MKTFKFSLVLSTRENTDVFIILDDNIYGIHSKRVNILYLFIKAYVVGTHLNCIDDAIQMSTHNICLYKEVDKKYTGCNLNYGIA